MAADYTLPSLVPVEKENVHFNTLMRDAHALIEALSGEVWTDTAIHDPGITLLEALAWNISDISYRCLLPLQDLLTLPEAETGDPLFPAGFSPEQMFTTSPVTVDDYRRGILDLYSDKGTYGGGYYFSDAQLRKQVDKEQFSAFYDENNRRFVFEKEEEAGEGYTPLTLKGGYDVQARVANVPFVDAGETHQQVLDAYLASHRNLCEFFPQVTVINEVAPLMLKAEINVSDAIGEINDFYAELYLCLQQTLNRSPVREAELDWSGDNYTGPQAQYGWIRALPPTESGRRTVSAGQFVVAINALEGVESVRYITLGPEGAAECESDEVTFMRTEPAGKSFVLWSQDENWEKQIEQLDKLVVLYQNDIRLSADVPTIINKVRMRLAVEASRPTPPMEVGRYRNLHRYYPASSMIPPLYNLQAWSPDENTQQLHRFLLGFEQQLANHCDELAQLSRHLQFFSKSSNEHPLYGDAWPFENETPYDAVYTKVERQTLQKQNTANQHSRHGELALSRYLLGYFGVDPLEPMMASDSRVATLLAISRALLPRMPQIGYARTATHINQVSSLQYRLAGQLGYGLPFFAANPSLKKLPFYVVEHPLLLPDMPSKKDALPGWFGQVISARKTTLGDEDVLLIEAAGALKDILTARHLIDLQMQVEQENQKESGTDILITNLLVIALGSDLPGLPDKGPGEFATEDKENCFFLSPSKFKTLRLHLDRVIDAANSGKLTFEFSNTWLNEMSYMLEGKMMTKEAEDKTWTITTASDQPWPAVLNKGDTLVLKEKFFELPDGMALDGVTTRDAAKLEATVLDVDSFAGKARIEMTRDGGDLEPARRYSWYIAPGENPLLRRDRFSFTLSMVFPRRMIPGVDGLANSDIDKEVQRIRRLVQAEMPAHIQARVLWLSDDQFAAFGEAYARWQSNRQHVGEDTLRLLRMLSLGMLGELLEGIGEMKIPSTDEAELLDKFGDIAGYKDWEPEKKQDWHDLIDKRGLLFVPPSE
ncbi:hypothetical protein P8971_23645 [Serratia marcescens]|uniref:hypothetical protein n=1 Tax=Serratia marcescens TaxID=615 RepID=UPI003204C094